MPINEPLLKIPKFSLFVPPDFVFVFFWDLQWSREKLETMLYVKFGGTNKESYDIFESGLLHLFYMWICFSADYRASK